jgi:hypothetical protein
MRKLYRHPMFRRLVAAVLMLDVAGSAMANPTGMTVHERFRHRHQQRFTAHRHHDFAKHFPQLAEFQYCRR